MENNRSQKVILITGASSGIGKESAKQLVSKGYRVYAAARRLEQMQDLEALGCATIRMDISKEEEVEEVVGNILDEAGTVDVLVNNAGYATQGPVEEMPLEDARAIFDVNLFGLGYLTKLVLPGMREQGAGRIVNIGSAGGKVYLPLSAWYIASKHALEGWNDCLRTELKQFGIDVVLIEPGAIATEFNGVAMSSILERSGDGPYGKLAHAYVNLDVPGSHPSVIADVIVKAVETKKTKYRYVAGKMARTTIGMRKWLGDKAYDRLLDTIYKV